MVETVSAVYPDYEKAGRAIEALEVLGFDNKELSVLASESSTETFAAEGTSVGAGAGTAAGAAIAGLAAVGGITATGGVSLLATGPLLTSLVGAGAGGLIGGLIGLGFRKPEAEFIDEKVRKGSVLVGVKTPPERKKEVRALLESTHPEKITEL